MGMLLLFGAVAAVIVTIRPWTVSKVYVTWDISLSITIGYNLCVIFIQVGVACLVAILFLVFVIGVIHYWTSNNFYLTRTQMLLVCSIAFLLALAAFLMGLFHGD